MIDRAELEFTLAMAEKGIRAEAPAKVMEELCRVYLAYLDAPEIVWPVGEKMTRGKFVEVADVGG